MNPQTSPLLTDFYQLAMLHAYFDEGMDETAVFEFFVRKLPPGRNFLMAAGLEQALQFLEGLRFGEEDLDWLSRQGTFSRPFVDSLANFAFTGDVDAMPEGTLFFPDEPILRVAAPISQAQLVETRLINLLHFQTIIASKAARCVLAAPGRLLVDFGLRRAHGAEAGLLAARAAYLAGFSGTATVLAGPLFGIPLYGTMAHSYIEAHGGELSAFEGFARARPANVTFLIDTYDTEAAARKLVDLIPRLERQGVTVRAVRLDSGDLAAHARAVRAILDEGGLHHVGIFCSGGVDEYKMQRLLAAGAPISGFGVGTRLDTSADAPYLDCAYKLQEYAGTPRRKRSEGKATWPGRRQVYRQRDGDGRPGCDVVTLEGDPQEGEPLLKPVMRGGRRLAPPVPLDASRALAAAELARLPEPLRQLQDSPIPYRVEIAPALKELAEALDRQAY
jgi:nicotinate phosphoribosyltransferase